MVLWSCPIISTYICQRASTLAIWLLIPQLFPLIQDNSRFSVVPVLYKEGTIQAATAAGVTPVLGNAHMQGVIAVLALAINVIVLGFIIKKSVAAKKNPYKYDVFTDTPDYKEAMSRAQ